MQRKPPVLLITILLGVLALGATAFLLLGPKPGPPAPAPGTVQAAVPTPTPSPRWVASRDIPPRTVVSSLMMRRDFAPGAIPEGAVKSLDDVRGQITTEPIGAGETVLLSSFTQRLQRKVAANIPIPTGLRGVAIWVDPSQTAAGLVDVGDRIDVIATHKLSYEKAPRQVLVGAASFTTGRTIAQNLLVLGVDNSINAPAPTPTPVPGAPAAAAPPPTPVPPAGPPATRTRVLVAATPDIAARLVAANDQGLLNVTIRNPNDGDAGLVPEAREYPSRLYTPPREPSAADATRSTAVKEYANSFGKEYARQTASNQGMTPPSAMPPMPVPSSNNTGGSELTAPRPNNIGGSGMTAPDALATKEITVIRGTEKTRVIVPQR
ncbi:Flp pilus assembly protein CpaB [Abditibacterium utsteinense]|uniref:Flp pilus assembly protein CpaB n=1 Tax=Abditibacterium utsteinense TaxID=1960156 RepID=A0A2S8ST77_9BACT|nr:Flp pilus assembly protein CpaB [Abditibacterium utsteinense]PQV64000.1 Flp pilus assembly protein CpaB [Abditibacterium utsteinense]